MYQSFYQGNPFLDLPILGMLLFVLTFTAVVIRSWLRGQENPTHERLSQLPLDSSDSVLGGSPQPKEV